MSESEITEPTLIKKPIIDKINTYPRKYRRM